MNARFKIPDGAQISNGMVKILNLTLQADPNIRISCEEVWSLLDSLNDSFK